MMAPISQAYCEAYYESTVTPCVQVSSCQPRLFRSLGKDLPRERFALVRSFTQRVFAGILWVPRPVLGFQR